MPGLQRTVHSRPGIGRDTASVKSVRKDGTGGFTELGKIKWYMWEEQEDKEREKAGEWINTYYASLLVLLRTWDLI